MSAVDVRPLRVIGAGDAYREAASAVDELADERAFGPATGCRPKFVAVEYLEGLAADLRRLGENADAASRELLFDGDEEIR